MNKEPLVFIEHILESIKNIELFSKKLSKEKFLKDKLRQNAIVREIEVIGEAVKNLPQTVRDNYPNIEWRKIAGTRDKIIHNYFNIDLDILWDIIVGEDITILKKQIQEIKKDLEKKK